jgi:hypothetical protein
MEQRSAAIRFAARLAWLMLAVAACSGSTEPRWVDDGAHLVDGYWVLAERPCDVSSADPCADFVRPAMVALDVDPTLIIESATAGLPGQWMRSDGRVVQVLFNSTGAAQFVVFDLADGSRRVIAVGCSGVPTQDGSHGCGRTWLGTYRDGFDPIDRQ